MVQTTPLFLGFGMLVMSTLALPVFNISTLNDSTLERRDPDFLGYSIWEIYNLVGMAVTAMSLEQLVDYLERTSVFCEKLEDVPPMSGVFHPDREDIDGRFFEAYIQIQAQNHAVMTLVPGYVFSPLHMGYSSSHLLKFISTARHNERDRIIRAMVWIMVKENPNIRHLPPDSPLVRLNNLRIAAFCDLEVLTDLDTAVRLLSEPDDAETREALRDEWIMLKWRIREAAPTWPADWRDTCKSPLVKWINERVTEVEVKLLTLNGEAPGGATRGPKEVEVKLSTLDGEAPEEATWGPKEVEVKLSTLDGEAPEEATRGAKEVEVKLSTLDGEGSDEATRGPKEEEQEQEVQKQELKEYRPEPKKPKELQLELEEPPREPRGPFGQLRDLFNWIFS